MAKKAGVDTMLIGEPLLKDTVSNLPPAYGTMQRWLLRNRQRLVTGGATQDTVYAETPDTWEQLASQAWLGESGQVQGLLRKLTLIKPEHPILRRVAEAREASGEPLTPSQLASTVRGELTRHLSDVRTSQGVNPKLPQTYDYGLKYRKEYVTGLPTGKGEWAHEFVSGRADGLTSMASILGLGGDRIVALVADPERNPRQAEPAIELSLLREIEKLDRPRLPDLESERGKPVERPWRAHYEDQLVHRGWVNAPEQRKTRRWVQWVARVAATAIIGVGVGQAYHVEHDHLETVEGIEWINTENSIARGAGIPLSDLQPDSTSYALLKPIFAINRIYNLVNEGDLRVDIMDNVDTIAGDISTGVGDYLGEGTTPNDPCSYNACAQIAPDTANIGSQIGNAGDGEPDQPVWQLHEHGQSATGLWPAYISDELVVGGGQGRPVDETWMPDQTVIGVRSVPTDVPKTPGLRYIQVSRTLVPGDVSPRAGYGEVMDVPVLDHDQIIAAQLTGTNGTESAKVLEQAGGTEALELPANVSARDKLTYWVAPSGSSVHAVARARIAGTFPYDTAAMNHVLASIDPSWTHQTAYERAVSVAEYTHTKFQYEVNPLDPRDFIHDQVLAQVIAKEIATRKANCNVANNIVEFADLLLNPAIGFNDDGSVAGQQALDSHAAHFFLMDAAGNPLDGTPSTISPSQAAYFNVTSPSPNNHELPVGLLLGAGLLGYGAYRRRRELVGAGQVLRMTLATSAASYMPKDPSRIRYATELATALHYRPTGVNFESVARRARHTDDGEQTGGQAEQVAAALGSHLIVMRPDLHTFRTIRAMHQLGAGQTSTVKAEIRRSILTLGIAHTAWQLSLKDYRVGLSEPISRQ